MNAIPTPATAGTRRRPSRAALLGLGATALVTTAVVVALSPKLPPFVGD